MKERLIIISDLWGDKKCEWLVNYTKVLEKEFNITYYDSCKLGHIDRTVDTQENIHQQFINGGIDTAVNRLIELEKHPIHILAFSIGGTIAWKYGLKSENIISLTCLSSTRLRKEEVKPQGRIKLFFGENDMFKPDIEWFNKMNIEYNIVADEEHDFYRHSKYAERLCGKNIRD